MLGNPGLISVCVSALLVYCAVRSHGILTQTSFSLASRRLVRLLLWMGWVLPVASAHAGVSLPVAAFPGSTAVTQQSAPLAVSVAITQPGTATTPVVVTQGNTGLDFQVAAGSTCQAGAAYTAGQLCTVNVVFNPKYPGLRSGAVLLESTSGTVLGFTLVHGTATGGLSVLVPGRINTIAGNAAWIYNGDGALATQSSIFLPMGIVTDAAGNMYISDTDNNRIRRVDAASGFITTVGGSGSPGYSGDGGLATAAEVNTPAGIVLDGAGDLYVADTGNHAIRRIDAVTKIITTVAGIPTDQGYTGDGAAAVHATLSLPEGLAFDPEQNLYIADTGNNAVRKVSAATGVITTVAGTGVAGYSGNGGAATSAQLNSPWSVAIGSTDGLLYIADLTNNVVRRVSAAGNISTVAGTGTAGFTGDDGAATSAELNEPASVVFDPAGNMYIGDSGNNRVRQVLANSQFIQTLVGTGDETFSGDTSAADLAGLYGPYALYLDQSGDLLIADMFHNRIREVSANAITLSYATMRVDRISAPAIETVANDGNDSLTFAAPTLNQSALSAAETTCTTGTVLDAATSCTMGVEFAPTTVGDPVEGTLDVNSGAANSPAAITLLGEVLSVNPTSVGLTSSQNPSLSGSYVTFTAIVTSAGSNPTGTITLFDGTTQICSVTVANNTVYCGAASLTVGQHSITASYSGDNDNAASVSPVLNQVIQQTPTLTLSTSPNPAVATGAVVLTASATGPADVPTGTVTFYDGTIAIATAGLNSNGTGTVSTTSLSPGTHNLSATYGGDTVDIPATSNTVNEAVNQATTVTNMSSSDATVSAGQSITLSATVSSPNGPTPAGTVVFKSGTTVLGTGTLSSNGATSVVLASLPVGAYGIVATYSGDVDDAISSSSALTEVVRQIATTTSATSSSNPASGGATIDLKATVALASGATADGAITGTVTFTDGTATIGTAALNSAGQAVLPVDALSAGMHSIAATYNGSTNYATSSSAAFSERIDDTATTTVISAASSAIRAGQAATFTFTVSSSTGTPTGTVTVFDGSNSIGQATLNATGMAVFTTTNLSIGSHGVKAVYSGDPQYLSSSSATLQETVTIGTTALTLAGPSTPVDAGVPVSLVASLTTNGVAPTGALTLRDGGTVIATQTVSAAGSFSFTSSSLSVGTHTLTAAYAGDSDNAASASAALTVVVQQGPTTTSFSTSANPSTLGQSLTLSASVSSVSPNLTGSIAFADGGAILGSVSVVNGTASFTTSSLTFGAHSLTAVYSGDTNHSTSTSAAVSEQIVEPAKATLISSYNPSVSGANVTFNVRISVVGSLIPTGSVVFSNGAATLGTVTLDATGAANLQTSGLSVGTHTIAVAYSGDRNYSTASATLIQTVQDAGTQVALAASSNPATYGAALSMTATVSSNGGTATGSVTFTEGEASIGTAVLNASGVATLVTSTLQPGEHTIVAGYAGDGKASASVSTPLDLTVKQLSAVTLASSANPATTLSSITFMATVSNSGVGEPSGAITFTDGGTQLGTATLNANGQASFTVASLAAGSHVIAAAYAGDTDNFASNSVSLSQSVQLRPTTTSLSSSATDAGDPQQVTLIAIVRWTGATTPTGTVTFSDASGVMGTSTVNSTGVATLTVDLQASTESITATYGGDTAYATSASPATSVASGVATQFTLTVTPSTASVQSSQHLVVALTATSLQGFSDTLQLGCLGLPYAATCTFSTPQTKLAANGASTVQLTVDTSNPLGEGAQASNHPVSGSRISGSQVMVCMLPGTLLASLLFFRQRRRGLLPLLLLLCAVAMSVGATGCGGLKGSSTPAGSYSFRVTASGVGSGFTQTQVMNLTVTQ